MTEVKAVAIVALWLTCQFDTMDISRAIDCPEADVCAVLGIWREHGRWRRGDVRGALVAIGGEVRPQ